MRGVVADPQVLAPLGRLYWQVGAHFFGIDDSYEQPIIARAYYDPARDDDPRARGDARFFGYLQFVQILFDGVPVPPDSYGGQFADRGVYAGAELDFVDFMGPADAGGGAEAGPRHPFYAYGGSLPGAVAGARDFAAYPRRNGVLLFPAATGARDQARGASLVTAVSPGLLSPDDVRPLLTTAAFEHSVTAPATEVARRGAFDIALADLLRRGQLGGRGVKDLAGEAVGPYLLVKPPEGQWVCATLDPTGTRIDLYRIDAGPVESARESAALRGLWKMAEVVHVGDAVDTRRVVADIDSSVLPGLGPVWTPRSPAGGGIEIPPLEFGEKDFAVEWRYTTYLFAERSHQPGPPGGPLGGLIPLHGFSWSVCQKFAPATTELVATSVRAPRLLTEFPAGPALRRYYERLARYSGNPSTAPAIDASPFTAAGFPYLPFGRGRKLTVLDGEGAS